MIVDSVVSVAEVGAEKACDLLISRLCVEMERGTLEDFFVDSPDWGFEVDRFGRYWAVRVDVYFGGAVCVVDTNSRRVRIINPRDCSDSASLCFGSDLCEAIDDIFESRFDLLRDCLCAA